MKTEHVKPDGTIVTQRSQDVVPNTDARCQAMVTTQIVLCEPMSDGSWRLITSFQDNYNIEMENRDCGDATKELVENLNKVKAEWKNKELLISSENLLNVVQK